MIWKYRRREKTDRARSRDGMVVWTRRRKTKTDESKDEMVGHVTGRADYNETDITKGSCGLN